MFEFLKKPKPQGEMDKTLDRLAAVEERVKGRGETIPQPEDPVEAAMASMTEEPIMVESNVPKVPREKPVNPEGLASLKRAEDAVGGPVDQVPKVNRKIEEPTPAPEKKMESLDGYREPLPETTEVPSNVVNLDDYRKTEETPKPLEPLVLEKKDLAPGYREGDVWSMDKKKPIFGAAKDSLVKRQDTIGKMPTLDQHKEAAPANLNRAPVDGIKPNVVEGPSLKDRLDTAAAVKAAPLEKRGERIVRAEQKVGGPIDQVPKVARKMEPAEDIIEDVVDAIEGTSETAKAEMVQSIILDTDPRIKDLKRQLNEGSLTREQYFAQVRQMQKDAPLVEKPKQFDGVAGSVKPLEPLVLEKKQMVSAPEELVTPQEPTIKEEKVSEKNEYSDLSEKIMEALKQNAGDIDAQHSAVMGQFYREEMRKAVGSKETVDTVNESVESKEGEMEALLKILIDLLKDKQETVKPTTVEVVKQSTEKMEKKETAKATKGILAGLALKTFSIVGKAGTAGMVAAAIGGFALGGAVAAGAAVGLAISGVILSLKKKNA